MREISISQRKPEGIYHQEGLLAYTDRGAQHTSQRFQAFLMRYGFRQSMSRKGNPYDNAVMESF